MYYNGCFFTKNPSQALSGKNHNFDFANTKKDKAYIRQTKTTCF